MAQPAETLKIPTSFHSQDTRVLLLMATALGLKDKYTHAHAQRVAAYAKRLAIRMGLPMREVAQISMGGMLHDVGKLTFSDSIFSNKKTSLSKEMMLEVRNHPLIGAALLEKVNCVPAVFHAVLYHHERIDGSGYPFGLEGEAIPLSAKIVSIADCFDAITTDRPYQKRKNREAAFSVLNEIAGAWLAEDLVSLFIEEVRSNGMARCKDA